MIVLWDVSSLAHRVYHTSAHFNISGEPCGIPVGYFKVASRICTELKESFLEPIRNVACMDFGRCAKRTELYPEYKAGRKKPATADFLPQMHMLETALPQFGFQICKSFLTEADDLVGVMSQELEVQSEERLVIVSSDKDLWQLITDRVRIYNLGDDSFIGPVEAREKLGFSHERLVEYKSLAGDSSDNIPGAKGVGEKTAKKILDEHPDIRELLASLASTPSEKVAKDLKKVAESMDSVLLAGKLCTIAQYKDQLWDTAAQEVITQTVDAVLQGKMPPFDAHATALLADMWRVDGGSWPYAFG